MVKSIYQGLRQYALTPTYASGKSQVLLNNKGDNRVTAKVKVLNELKKTINIPGLELDIKVVTNAKHLSGIIDADNTAGPEIRHRQLQTSQASTSLRHSPYLQRHIETERHVYVADSLVKSR